MSWITEDGEHEGWVASILDDGRHSIASTGRRRDDGSVEFLELVTSEGDHDDEEQVSADRVCEWVVQCSCGWRGSRWERVTELHQASDAGRREWRPLGEVGHEPQHVADIAYTEWQRHLEPHESFTAVHHAAAQVAPYQRQLDTAVLNARQQGLSWKKIGTAAGISHQAARERWGPMSTRSRQI